MYSMRERLRCCAAWASSRAFEVLPRSRLTVLSSSLSVFPPMRRQLTSASHAASPPCHASAPQVPSAAGRS
eukprot:4830487-Pleurochrysis_carterae.AAC.1